MLVAHISSDSSGLTFRSSVPSCGSPCSIFLWYIVLLVLCFSVSTKSLPSSAVTATRTLKKMTWQESLTRQDVKLGHCCEIHLLFKGVENRIVWHSSLATSVPCCCWFKSQMNGLGWASPGFCVFYTNHGQNNSLAETIGNHAIV